jgi:hypothetical protein
VWGAGPWKFKYFPFVADSSKLWKISFILLFSSFQLRQHERGVQFKVQVGIFFAETHILH